MQGDVATTIVLWGLILLGVLIWHIASKWRRSNMLSIINQLLITVTLLLIDGYIIAKLWRM